MTIREEEKNKNIKKLGQEELKNVIEHDDDSGHIYFPWISFHPDPFQLMLNTFQPLGCSRRRPPRSIVTQNTCALLLLTITE